MSQTRRRPGRWWWPGRRRSGRRGGRSARPGRRPRRRPSRRSCGRRPRRQPCRATSPRCRGGRGGGGALGGAGRPPGGAQQVATVAPESKGNVLRYRCLGADRRGGPEASDVLQLRSATRVGLRGGSGNRTGALTRPAGRAPRRGSTGRPVSSGPGCAVAFRGEAGIPWSMATPPTSMGSPAARGGSRLQRRLRRLRRQRSGGGQRPLPPRYGPLPPGARTTRAGSSPSRPAPRPRAWARRHDGFGAVTRFNLKAGATALVLLQEGPQTRRAPSPSSLGAPSRRGSSRGGTRPSRGRCPPCRGRTRWRSTTCGRTPLLGLGAAPVGRRGEHDDWTAPLPPAGIDPELGAGFLLGTKPGGNAGATSSPTRATPRTRART